MNVLMISKDPKIFDSQSDVYKRTEEYRKLFDNLYVIVLNKNPINFLYAFIEAGKIAKKFKRDDWITSQDPFETGLFSLIIAKVFRLKLQIQVHTDCINDYYKRLSVGNLFRFHLAKIVIPYAHSIRVVSKKISNSLQNNLKIGSKSRVFVLPVFIDKDKFNSNNDADLRDMYPNFEKFVLIVARLEKEKNITMALQAFKKVLRVYPNTGMFIVGSGSEEANLKKYCNYLGISKNIIFVGWVINPASYYKSADVLFVTSYYEGYGMNMVEASLCGCPIVSTDVGVAGEVGAIITKFDPGDMALKLCDVLKGHTTVEHKCIIIEKDEYLKKYRDTFSI